MSSDEELRRQLLATFKTELEDYLLLLNRNIVELERGNPGPDIIQEIFRAAHNLKGAAGVIGLAQIQSIAHTLENLFSAIRQHNFFFTPAAFDLSYQGLDLINRLMTAELAGAELPPLDREFADQLERLLSNGDNADPQNSALSTATVSTNDRATIGTSVQTSNSAGVQQTRVNESLRIPLIKIERLMSDMGELLIAGNRYQQRRQEADQLQLEMAATQKHWLRLHPLRRKLKKLSAQRELSQLLAMLEQHQALLKSLGRQIDQLTKRLRHDELQLSISVTTVQKEVQGLRMLPIDALFEPLHRQVRDLQRQHNKRLQLELIGGAAELDRQLIEAIREPLIHLIRNSIDHGLEPEDERLRAGKPAEGRLRCQAKPLGNQFLIEFSDDGRGIDLAMVKERAIANGQLSLSEAETINKEALLALIFQAGFSTRESITETSGRGVGLDIVKVQIERLRGQVRVSSEPGLGTTFQIILPLTLSTVRVLMIRIGNEIYAMPVSAVQQALHIKPRDCFTIESRLVISLTGRSISVIKLADLLGSQPDKNLQPTEWLVLMLTNGHEQAVFIIDEIIGEQEIVIKSLGNYLQKVINISGATVLGDGRVVLLLDPIELMLTANHKHNVVATTATVNLQLARSKRKILVVDDSLTTRTLEKNILEIAGYEVILAKDGVEGLALARTSGCELVISDIEMPRLTGIDLTKQIKADEQLKELPVILVSSLGSEQDRARGVQSGADAYIVKNNFDQARLLELVENLLLTKEF